MSNYYPSLFFLIPVFSHRLQFEKQQRGFKLYLTHIYPGIATTRTKFICASSLRMHVSDVRTRFASHNSHKTRIVEIGQQSWHFEINYLWIMATSSKKKPPASIWNEFSVSKDKKRAHDETAINVLVTFAKILEQLNQSH